jgi:glycerol-3-phosphate dehydrogenase
VSALGPAQRAEALRRAPREEWDVAVVGGGVTGAGVALDAASRGLRTILLERGDLASGTSSRSGRTLHGGLRYLEQGNLRLVRDAARERDLAVSRLCPRLCRPTRFLVPLTRPVIDRAYLGAGVALYDLLARGPLPRHRHLSRRGALAACPELREDRVAGGLVYSDVIIDDARHTVAVARTAAAHGAAIVARAEVTALALTDPSRAAAARIAVSALDHESGAAFELRARVVINAAGPGAAAVQRLAGASPAPVRPSKGIHLVVPRERLAMTAGLMARAGDSVVVVRPSGNAWLIGTTDAAWDGEGEPVAAAEDVDELLASVNAWLRRPLTRADVAGVFAGIRPLVGGGEGATAALRRDHAVITGPDWLFTVAGGKYTTYRLMARDAVDAAARRLAVRAPSVTERIPLVDDPPPDGTPLAGAPEHTEAEILHAVSHEGALHLEDVLERRTRIATEHRDGGLAAARRVAELLGLEHELEDYRERVRTLRAGL